MKNKHILLISSVLICLVIFSSCAPAHHTAKEYGFLYGIVHGFLFFFALIGKLFGVTTGLYAEHNSGFLYWLGFIIGIGGLGGGGREATRRR